MASRTQPKRKRKSLLGAASPGHHAGAVCDVTAVDKENMSGVDVEPPDEFLSSASHHPVVEVNTLDGENTQSSFDGRDGMRAEKGIEAAVCAGSETFGKRSRVLASHSWCFFVKSSCWLFSRI